MNTADLGVIPWDPASWMSTRQQARRPPPEAAIPPALVFVGGLHRSGTSLVHRCLASHPAVSGFSDTGVPEDEGQHLQTVYPPDFRHGHFNRWRPRLHPRTIRRWEADVNRFGYSLVDLHRADAAALPPPPKLQPRRDG